MTKPLKGQTAFGQFAQQNYKFKAFAELSWEICNNHDDNIMFINGVRGSGKSMAGVAYLRYYLENFFGIEFNKQVMRDHIVYEHELLFERAKNLPPKHPILVDEGVRVAYTGDFGTREVKDLIKFFAQCRTKNRFVIFVSPDFFDMAKRMRQYARYRMRMIARGTGVLFARDNAEGVDPFHLDTLRDAEKYHDDMTPVPEVISRIRKHPCFKDVISIPEVPQYIQEWYDAYRDESVYRNTQVKMHGMNDRAAYVLWNLYYNWKDIRCIEKLTRQEMFKNLCINPITNDHFVETDKWIDEAIKTVKDAIKEQEAHVARELKYKEEREKRNMEYALMKHNSNQSAENSDANL